MTKAVSKKIAAGKTVTAEFRDLSKVDLVGAYPNYDAAHRAWLAKAQATVDNAHMRYFIIHAHKLLDPSQPGL